MASIVPEIRSDLHAYLGGIVREEGGTAVAVGGTADHVHMLVELPADRNIADCMRVVKTNSSRWVHEKWPRHRRFAWQAGYGAFAVSSSNASRVIEYIRHIPVSARALGVLMENGEPHPEDAARLAKDRMFVRVKLNS